MNIENSLKILCITQRFFPVIGGAENVVKNYMDLLSKNHSVTVFTTNAYDLKSFWDQRGKIVKEEEIKNYVIKRFPILIPKKVNPTLYNIPFTISSPGPFCPELWNSLLNMTEKFDLIIATAFPYDHIIPAFLAAKKFNIPFIVIPHLHLEFPYLYFTSIKLSILSGSDLIIVNTIEEKKALVLRSIPEDKIHVISPGIKIDNHVKTQNDIRQKFNIPENSIIILFAGTKSQDKGIIDLMQVMKKLWSQNVDVFLILIGSTTLEFSKYMEKQNALVKRRILDLGIVSEDEKWKIFDACDILAIPSKSESFGISYLEAWLFKKPVVACDIKAVSNVIDNEKNGLLIKFGDKEELFLAIQKLLDPKLRKMLGENGFEKLSQKFDSEEQSRKFEELCLSLVKV